MRGNVLLTVLGLVLWLVSAPSSRAEAVRVWQGTIKLPTYLLGTEDPYPVFPLSAGRFIYPYTQLAEFTDQAELHSHQALFLENPYLKVIVLPDLGGRVYSVFDKVNGREVFYRNNVVKYAPIALRGAWISGGIEFNFPDGHTVTTVSPVFRNIRVNPDGSAAIVVGNLDQVTGMFWEVALTLKPMRAHLEQRVTLFNPNPTEHIYWYWANAAVPATDDMIFIFPTREMIRHGRHIIQSYPMSDGVDWSKYANIKAPSEGFAHNVRRGFFGAYYSLPDHGVIHVADFHEVPGKKFFSWGVAEDGLKWTTLLTDNDGPYNEIQSGRYETQLNYEFKPPHDVESWTEYWYPVQGLQGRVVEATREMALNVEFSPGTGKASQQVIVSICPIAAMKGAVTRIKLGSKLIRELSPVDLEPLKPRRFSLPVTDIEVAKRELIVEIETGQGNPLLRWLASKPIDGNPDFIPSARSLPHGPKLPHQMTTAELFLEGVELERGKNFEGATRIYEQVLDRDPSHVPSLLKLAWRHYRAADLAGANDLLKQALNRTDNDPAVYYTAGVIHRAAGRRAAAEDAFWSSIRYGGQPARSLTELAEMALRQREYDRAVALFQRALRHNADDPLARTELAVAYRLSAKPVEAKKLVHQVLADTALLPFALAESWRLAEVTQQRTEADLAWKRWRKSTTPDVQCYLDVGSWYRTLGDLKSAEALLQASLKELPKDKISPLIFYYLAAIARDQGRTKEAAEFQAEAGRASYVKVFPNRLSDAQLLKEVRELSPSDPHACYFLGNFLFARGRYEDAAAEWQRALRAGFDVAVLRRNLGFYLWRVKGDRGAASAHYERAIQQAPDDLTLYTELDDIYFQMGDRASRATLLGKAPGKVLARDVMRVRQALLAIQQLDYDKALSLLANHRFRPGEGESIVRDVYVLANLQKGRALLRSQDYYGAETTFRHALEYPENFFVGKPHHPLDHEAYYWLGETLNAVGKQDEARAAWQQASLGGPMVPPVTQLFQALAQRRLRRNHEAQERVDRIAQAADSETASVQDLFVGGIALLSQGQNEMASTLLRRALALDPLLWRARLELEALGAR